MTKAKAVNEKKNNVNAINEDNGNNGGNRRNKTLTKKVENKNKEHKFDNPHINIIKKNGTRQAFDGNKIRSAIEKSAERVMVDLTEEAKDEVVNLVIDMLKNQTSDAEVNQIHNCVEAALEQVNPLVAKSYREYRNYKNDFVHILDTYTF